MLDDFGTGYSSFGRLASLPIDIIKIDKSFVDNIEGESRPIIEAICSRAFDMKLVAEGVETLVQATSLRSMGVHYLQGYFISRRLPQASVEKWLVTAGAASTRPLAHIMRAMPSA
jgi:sensor c-di-GMP phosphodiesterase-like protein